MKHNGVIESKLRLLEQKVAEIRSWEIPDHDALATSSLLRNAVERALQVAIEIVIDVCERILSQEGEPPPPTSAEAVRTLGKLGILQKTQDFEQMVRFRNFIVHRYEQIDTDILFSLVQNRLHLFDEFVDSVRRSL